MTEVILEEPEYAEMKESIREVVENYKATFPDEYEQLKKSIKNKRGQIEIEGNEFAELEDMEAVERHAWDIPQRLFTALKSKLDEQTFQWMFARGEFDNDFSGVKWFMNEYEEFSVSKSY